MRSGACASNPALCFGIQPAVKFAREVRMAGATRWLAAGALLLAAASLHPTAPLAWGGADAPDGTRFKVSLVGLSHVLDLHRTVSPSRDCRWAPPSGDAELCRVAPEGEAAFIRLRAVLPALRLAVGLCVVAAGLSLSRRAPIRLRLAATLAAAAAPALVMLLFATSAGAALSVLRPLHFGLAATRATMQAMLAMLLGLMSARLQVGTRLHPAASAAAIVAATTAPFVGLRFGGWPGVGAGFALSAFLLFARPGRGASERNGRLADPA